MRKISTYMAMGCMVLFAMLLGSCERDTWQAGYESTGSGEPVNVILSFEAPKANDVAVTRTMSELEEHNITDLYVLIFDASSQKLISRQYYDDDALEHSKESHVNGEWGSVLDDYTNSTHATVMAKAVDSNVLIFGIANVRGEDSEVSRSSSDRSTLDESLLAMKTVSQVGEDNATTLNEFYNLQTELRNDITLSRVNSHLLMSGVFVLKDEYKPTTTGYNAFTSKYEMGTAGLVDLAQSNIQALKDENTGAIDLTQAGVIRLRRVASHITFKISINADKNGNGLIDNDEKIFSDFKPESWQVFNVPNRSYLMDQGLESIKIIGDANFTDSEVERSMLHADDKYVFDFYMYENHKSAKDISDEGDAYSYYKTAFGNTINAVNGTNRALYTDDEEFKYFKRDLALKDSDGKYLTDTDGDKQFVYLEPNATYVLIKGRLRFNTANFGLEDLIKKGGVDKSTTAAIKDGYADVTYLVHLGYARTRSIQDETLGNNTGTQAYKFEDFNSLRNTEYTYNLTIQGVNSIYTQVVTETPNDADMREPAKLQAGASGFIGIASEGVYNTDAHFNSFIIFLDKPHLDKNGFYFEIRTPWNTIKSSDITDANYATHYKNNPDFTWIKVRRNYIQTFGDASDPVNYIGTDHRSAMPYYKASGDAYQTICPLIDLYQLKKELELFADQGLQMKIGDTEYGETAKLKFSNLDLTDENRNNDGLFYTVFLDEYYYQSPPLRNGSPVWSTASGHEPYWHEFANKPARYVSFSTNDIDSSASTHDGESSIMKPQLMIVQPSIQSHYAVDGGVTVGMGMEHYNETPHPRWTDYGTGKTPSGTYDRKYGWVNAKNHMAKSSVTWEEYVADYVGIQNNLTMTPKPGAKSPDILWKTSGSYDDSDAQYLANAIRLCMNRNRDENGNGYIDVEELKWYLPSSEQIDIMNMCHFSYYDPLLNYNNYIYEYVNGKPRYRIKKSTLDGESDVYPKEFFGGHCYNYHFVTSDNMKLIAEEMMNLNTYKQIGNWATLPGQMRCVRNLGEDASRVGTTKVKKLYFAYNLDDDDQPDGTVASETDGEEIQTYPGSVPQEIFEFLGKQNGGSGNPWTDKIFVMEKYLDSRSIRTAKYVNEELPPHYLFSETNRPYKAFKVAQNYQTMKKDDPTWTSVYADKRYIELNRINVNGKGPCYSYSEDADGKDLHSWRAPNAAELSLMIHYLRITNANGKAEEKEPPLFFMKSTSSYPFSCTSWNWAGDLNIRMVAVKKDDTYTRKLWMSDPYYINPSNGALTRGDYIYDEANRGLYDSGDIIIRCVKDVEPPINN